MKNKNTVLITAGAIPAALDSVKYLTNRFQGRLALAAATYLQERGFEVTVCAFKKSEVFKEAQLSGFETLPVDDVKDYVNKVMATPRDAYILSAAVANLMPSQVIQGKFPSHLYKVGDKFNIEFEIAPRLIDQIKLKYPRAALIGYKLYDGTEDELIQAAQKTLYQSKANVVFANSPATASQKKIAVTSDGATIPMGFQEHLAFMVKTIEAQFYSTQIQSDYKSEVPEDIANIFDSRTPYVQGFMDYGCVAVRDPLNPSSFWINTRGKQKGAYKGITLVRSVDHGTQTVQAEHKPSLNAPLMAKLFELNPHLQIIRHGHERQSLAVASSHDYQFPGTKQDVMANQKQVKSKELSFLPYHGYWIGFTSTGEFLEFENNISNYPQR